jgi:hypothetical protein
MFTLNNVFLCLNRLGVKFFQISGSTLQLQMGEKQVYCPVWQGEITGSVWAPSVFRISTVRMEEGQCWLCMLPAQEGLVGGLESQSPVIGPFAFFLL